MVQTMISKKNKKKYSVPTLDVAIMDTSEVMAGSNTIQKGQTDGNGTGQFSADAKKYLWTLDEEELAEDWGMDDWSYTF